MSPPRVTMGACELDFPGIEEILTDTHTLPLDGALPLSRSGIEGGDELSSYIIHRNKNNSTYS